MRPIALLATLALSLMTPAAGPAQTVTIPTGIVSLASLRGSVRPLLIFAPKPDDSQLEIQLRRLHDGAATVAQHDVVVIAIPYQSPSPTPAMLTDDGAEAARRRFNVAPADFAVILLGKDGAQKLRSARPISINQLRRAIDTVPPAPAGRSGAFLR